MACTICPYPFARMELNQSKKFVPCCGTWLTNDFLDLDHGEDPWNSPAAQELRRSVLDGSYKYCRLEFCKKPFFDFEDPQAVISTETPVGEINRAAILAGETAMPEGPAAFAIVNDLRCNLACPSCRSEHTFNLDEAGQQALERTEAFIEQHRLTLETMKISNGEAFFSPWLRSIIKRLSPERFPRMGHLSILCNGLLFDQKMYDTLLPGASFIRHVSISIDAGNRETYGLVRGGSWEKLLANLQWLGEMRRKKLIPYFQMNFTVQAVNFQSIPEFVALAKEVGASNVKFTAFFEFVGMAVKDIPANSIHWPSHPRHAELRAIWEHVRHEKIVRWALPEPALG